jgi:hypothetical protein
VSDATALFVIRGDDKTKAALDSARRGFQSLTTGVQQSASLMKASLGLLAGVQLKNLFRGVMEATAQSTAGARAFAPALDEVKRAAKDLMAAKGGLPDATKNLREMAETLKDPAVVKAVDGITSALVRLGTAGALAGAKTLAGMGLIATGKGGNAATDMDNSILRMQSERASILASSHGNPLGPQLERVKELDDAIKQATEGYWRLVDGARGRTTGRGGTRSAPRDGSAISGEVGVDPKKVEAARKESEKFEETLTKQRAAVNEQFIDEWREEQKALADRTEAWAKMNAEMTASAEAGKKVAAAFTMYADATLGGLQESFRRFFLDPAAVGIKGLARGFVDTFREALADIAAAKAAKIFFGAVDDSTGKLGGGLLSGAVNGILKSFMGFAGGGDFTVGGGGGTDSQLVAFRATPGETVSVRTPSQQGRSGISFTQNIAFSGDPGNRAQLAAFGRQIQESTVALIERRINGGAYAG